MNLIDALFIVALNYPLIEMDAKDCVAVFDKNSVCSPSSEMISKEFNLIYEKIKLERKHEINLSYSLLNTSKTQALFLNKTNLSLTEQFK